MKENIFEDLFISDKNYDILNINLYNTRNILDLLQDKFQFRNCINYFVYKFGITIKIKLIAC